MFTRYLHLRLATYLLLLTVSLVGATLWFVAKEYLYGATFLALCPISLILIYRLYLNNSRKITYMFESVENKDFSMHLAESGVNGADKEVNKTLNRIKNILGRARQETIEQEKYYEHILDSVSTGIVVLHENGLVYQCNNAAHRLLGLSVFTHINQLSKVDASLPELFRSIQPEEKRMLSFLTERGMAHLSMMASAMRLKEESIRIIALNDINSELDEKEIDSWIRLIRVLTHEIMNSMAPISSLTETLLERHGKKDPEIKSGLEVIHSTSKNLLSFVDSYRQFTRVPTPAPTLFYVKGFLETLVRLASNEPGCNRVQITLSVQPEELLLYADEQLIHQVVFNLLKNAVQALSDTPDAAIHLSAHCEEGERVNIEVSDNGPGIAADVAEQIFVPFFTTKQDGSGVGLSISRQIMRLHNGSITLKKSIPGQTTFRLSFD